MDNNICELNFASEPAMVRSIVRYLLDFIKSHSCEPDVICDLKLIFSELLYNAVVHGNKEDKNKKVYVNVKVISGCLSASIRDEGGGFDYNKAIEYACGDAALENEHGRGMLLVTSLTDNVHFNKKGNQIQFEKVLKQV